MINIVMCHKENDVIIRTKKGSDAEYETLQADDMQEYFSTMFLNTKQSCIFWVQDLRLYAESIIELLYAMDFDDVTEENPTVKKMHSRSFKYAIELKGNAYFIYVKVGKYTTYLYNTDNLLSNLSDFEILRDFGKTTGNYLKDLVDASYNAISMLNGFQAKKTPFTISMLAMRMWKKVEGLYNCDNLFDCKKFIIPETETRLSEYLRDSYHGGWNYLNNNITWEDYRHQPGTVYDVNSLYPFIMATRPLPWGSPEFFKGPEIPHANDDNYYYYVRVRITFDLKKGSFPYIQKRGDFRYRFLDYLETSDVITYDNAGTERRAKEIIDLNGQKKKVFPEFVFSKTDYELIKRHYDIHEEEIIDGVIFRVARCCFKHYVDHFYTIKQKADANGNTGEKRIAKMLLNGLSGTLAKKEKRTNIVYTEKNGVLSTKPVTSQVQSASYIHIASAILSYAREYTYERACANYDHFIYADTDSLHIFGAGYVPVNVDIDNKELGKWKIEKEFKDAVYMKRKCYVLNTTSNIDAFKVTLAGVPFGYKQLIEDTMNGYLQGTIIDYAKQGRYLDASDALIKRLAIKIYDEDTKPEEETNDPFYDRFYKFQKECKEDDICSALSYIPYPSGITVCNNFKISHLIMWEYMKAQSRYA